MYVCMYTCICICVHGCAWHTCVWVCVCVKARSQPWELFFWGHPPCLPQQGPSLWDLGTPINLNWLASKPAPQHWDYKHNAADQAGEMSAGDWSGALILSCLSSSLITQLLSSQYTVALQSSELGHAPSIWILKDNSPKRKGCLHGK